jgi:hypothetical protein
LIAAARNLVVCGIVAGSHWIQEPVKSLKIETAHFED